MDKDKLKALEAERRPNVETANYGWPTFRESGPLEHFGQIGIAFTDADNVLSGAVTKHGEDVEALEGKIANEASTRQQADQALDNKITAEASARQTADQALDKKVADEAKARTEADTATNSEITKLKDGKADKTALQALQTTVNSKADNTALQALQTTVSSKADSSTVTTLSNTVAGKVSKTTIAALAEDAELATTVAKVNAIISALA